MEFFNSNLDRELDLINPNYSAYLSLLEIPQSLMNRLKMISSELAEKLNNFSQDDYEPDYFYVELYNYLLPVIKDNIETVINKQKAELLMELDSIEARKNFAEQFQDKKEYSMWVSDAKKHSTAEYKEGIKRKLQQLEDFSEGLN
ncbi:MAG: hypothetical protein H0U73_04525 [Tatlockia sp.]|nr:hypothetical protein [Tatlockia sp.]